MSHILIFSVIFSAIELKFKKNKQSKRNMLTKIQDGNMITDESTTMKSIPKYKDADDAGDFNQNGRNEATVAAFVQEFHHFSLRLPHSRSVVVDSVLQVLNSQEKIRLKEHPVT